MEKEKNDKWFDTLQIETYNGEMEVGTTADEMKKDMKKLIILHQCGDNKKALIGQLKTMIYGIENDFNDFAS